MKTALFNIAPYSAAKIYDRANLHGNDTILQLFLFAAWIQLTYFCSFAIKWKYVTGHNIHNITTAKEYNKRRTRNFR